MNITHFYLAIIIGSVLSLLTEEFVGISCGGIIVPGYMAMVFDDITTILLALLISLITYFIVNYGFSKIMILFGKRKFVVTLLVALLLNMLFTLAYPALAILPFAALTFRGVGAITPALLANTYAKQGILYTVAACAILTAATAFLVNILV